MIVPFIACGCIEQAAVVPDVAVIDTTAVAPDAAEPEPECGAKAKYCEAGARVVCNADGRWMAPAACDFGCLEGRCNACTPGLARCDGDRIERCQEHGKGWVAAEVCDGACINGACCTPDCEDRACGSDGCGAQCGVCGPWHQCSDLGQCACTASCDDAGTCTWESTCRRACAVNACGAHCGTCASGACEQPCDEAGKISGPGFACEKTRDGEPTVCATTTERGLRCVPLCTP